jgi:multiple sugar transport system permease protein
MAVSETVPAPPFPAGVERMVNKEQPRRYLLYLLLPAVIVLAAITLYPFGWLIYMSLHEVVLAPNQPNIWRALHNFGDIFHSSEYQQGWLLLLRYTGICMVLEIGLGMLVAIILNRSRFEKLLVTIFLLPMMVAPIVVGLLWNFLYSGTFGWYFWLLRSLHLLTSDTVLGSTSSALYALIAIDVWEWTPLIALIVLASLKRVPRDQLEASWVDGAGPWRSFFQVVLPSIRPLLLIAILLRFMDNVRLIDTFVATTGGGPANATEILPYYLYQRSFQFFDLGHGAAIALTLLLVTILFAKVMVSVFEETEKKHLTVKAEEI